jgi:hypothetical protein
LDGQQKLCSGLAPALQAGSEARCQTLQHEQQRLDTFERTIPGLLLQRQLLGQMSGEHTIIPAVDQIERSLEAGRLEPCSQCGGRQFPEIVQVQEPEP